MLNKQQGNQPISYHTNTNLYSDNDSYISNSDTPNSQQFNQQSNAFDLNSVAVVNNIPQFVELYNQDNNSLSGKEAATVAETKESLNQRRIGNSNTVTLENTPEKNIGLLKKIIIIIFFPMPKSRLINITKQLLSLYLTVLISRRNTHILN